MNWFSPALRRMKNHRPDVVRTTLVTTVGTASSISAIRLRSSARTGSLARIASVASACAFIQSWTAVSLVFSRNRYGSSTGVFQ